MPNAPSKPPGSLLLFNCRACDDVQRITDRQRTCECAQSSAQLGVAARLVLRGPVRVLSINYEAYDGMAPGDTVALSVKEDRTWISR